MTRIYQSTALLFVALGVYVMWQAQHLRYWVLIGPGPGFFPFWLGGIFSVLSLAWFAQVSLRAREPMAEGFIPNRAGMVRLGVTLVALVLFTALADALGFRLAMFGFLLALILGLGRQNPLLALAIALIGAFGVFYLFDHYLQVHLPSASIEFLAELGL